MLEFKSEDNFAVKGRGQVFITKKPGITHSELNNNRGHPVLINGIKYMFVGHERYAISYAHTDNIDGPFAILVKQFTNHKLKKRRHR